MPRCDTFTTLRRVAVCLALLGGAACGPVRAQEQVVRSTMLTIGHARALTPEQIHSNHLTALFTHETARDVALVALDGAPDKLVAQALRARMTALAVPTADGPATCAALMQLQRKCTGMRDSDRSALIAAAGAINDFDAIFEQPEHLSGAAMVWPPTALLGSFLTWSGVPERQVPDMLSTQRGFDYAYASLFDHIADPIWCTNTNDAIALFARGGARAVLVKTSRIDDVIATAERTGVMSDLGVWESAQLTLSEPEVLWFDLHPGGAPNFAKIAEEHGYARFDTPAVQRADDLWRIAIAQAYLAHAPAPVRDGARTTCNTGY